MRCVRLALIVAALVGIALAQGAPCPDSMPIVPSATWATHAAAGLLAETADRMAEPALPLGLLGVCLTVLVAMVAAIAVRRRPEHGRAAVRRLEDHRVRAAFMQAMEAARDRSRELAEVARRDQAAATNRDRAGRERTAQDGTGRDGAPS